MKENLSALPITAGGPWTNLSRLIPIPGMALIGGDWLVDSGGEGWRSFGVGGGGLQTQKGGPKER